MARKRRWFNAPLNLSPSVQNITELCFPPDNSPSKVFIPVELIADILSLLSVKAIVRFKCVSKSWNTLTSDSNFVDKHLKVSSQNPHLTVSWYEHIAGFNNVVPIAVHRLLKTQSAIIFNEDSRHRANSYELVGSCNGLLCFVFNSWKKRWLRFWNPATRTRSEKFEFTFGYQFEFSFGFDPATRTYKVVAFHKENSEVKVFNLGDNCWRNIQNFPVVLHRFDHRYYIFSEHNNGVHFYGTINRLALDKSTLIQQFVIVSLDLSTETYKQFMLPLGFDKVSSSQLVLRVFMDCLCISHLSNKTEFVLWKMKEYRVQESWAQLFKINYHNLLMQHPIRIRMLPMRNTDLDQLVCLYVNGDIVIFASTRCKQSFIYNLKKKK
ncbi:F-box/kelch-repeat protein [Trifolium repens]|nr:F-box/kelch-repeat protein [Trifolium repens]